MKIKTDARRYSKDYTEFASQIIGDVCAAGYSASSRSLEAAWKNPEASASTRELVDVEVDPSVPHRLSTVTADLQHAYAGYLKGATAEATLRRVLKDVGLAIEAEKVNALFMSAPSPGIVPRDSSCLAPCLDGGASLRAYHRRIGYAASDPAIYSPGAPAQLGRAASEDARCEEGHAEYESGAEYDDRN